MQQTSIFLFFTLIVQTKLAWYILPCYPALSLSVGVFLAWCLRDRYEFFAKLAVAVVLILHIPFSSVIIQDYSPGIKALAAPIREAVGPQDTLFLYEFHESPAATFYCDRKVEYIDSVEELEKRLTKSGSLSIVISHEKYAEVETAFKANGFRVVDQTKGLEHDLFLVAN